MRKCGNCDLKAQAGGICPVFNDPLPDGEGCPVFTVTAQKCSICGTPILKGGIIEEDANGYYIVCGNCASLCGTCQICQNMNTCAFQTDTTCQEPPYVMVQYRQGNAVVQTQKQNPKRIEATCRKGCPCFDEDGLDNGTFCRKQNGYGCNNHKIKNR